MDDAIVLQIENRMRAMIIELMEPTIRRSIESGELLSKVMHDSELMFSRINDIEIVQTRTYGRLGLLDEHNKRFLELSASLSMIDSRMARDKQDLQTQVYQITEDFSSIREEISVLEHQRLDLKSDVTGISHNLMNSKYEVEQRIAAFKNEYRDKLNGFDERLVVVEVDAGEQLRKIKKLDDEIIRVDSIAGGAVRACEELGSQLRKLDGKFATNKNETSVNVESVRMAGIKLQAAMTKVEKSVIALKLQLGKAEEKAARINVKATQPLYKVITDVDALKVLAAYDLERLSVDVDKDLDVKALIQRAREYAESIMKIEKPKPPTPVPVPEKKKRKRTEKREKSIEKGRKASMKMPDESIRKSQNYNEIIEINSINPVLTINKTKEESESSESSDSSSSSSSKSKLIIPEQIDYSPMITQAKLELECELESKIATLAEDTSAQMLDFKAQLEAADKDLKFGTDSLKIDTGSKFKEAYKRIHDIELIVQQVSYECSSQINSRKRENNDTHFELSMLNDKIESYNKQFSNLIESIESISKKLSVMIEYSSVANALLIQDEIDRESISLMGYKQPSKATKFSSKLIKPVVSIEKQCFSCTNQSSVVLNAFKIACLAYTPSQVTFQNKKYTRRELLNIQSTILTSLAPLPESPLLEKRQRATSTLKPQRPVSVPYTNESPGSDFPDADLPRILRRSINL